MIFPFPMYFTPLVLASPSLSGSYVGYTRRQVCYLAAKALTGAHLDGTLADFEGSCHKIRNFPPSSMVLMSSLSGCSLGACQHRCNEVVIRMASHAICQRKARWVVRFETPNQNVLGSFKFPPYMVYHALRFRGAQLQWICLPKSRHHLWG